MWFNDLAVLESQCSRLLFQDCNCANITSNYIDHSHNCFIFPPSLKSSWIISNATTRNLFLEYTSCVRTWRPGFLSSATAHGTHSFRNTGTVVFMYCTRIWFAISLMFFLPVVSCKIQTMQIVQTIGTDDFGTTTGMSPSLIILRIPSSSTRYMSFLLIYAFKSPNSFVCALLTFSMFGPLPTIFYFKIAITDSCNAFMS